MIRKHNLHRPTEPMATSDDNHPEDNRLFLPSRDGHGVKWEKQSVMGWLGELYQSGTIPLQIEPVSPSTAALCHSSPPPIELSGSTQPAASPRYWDLSYIVSKNTRSTEKLRTLCSWAVKYEEFIYRQQHRPDPDAWETYQTLQHRMHYLFGQINHQETERSDNYHRMLDDLYEETIDQLRRLLNPSSSSSTPHPRSTADLTSYMTEWLRQNFTNPYPDEAGLAEMALACGTTPTVISNWLINARTRKWRPAIVQATELGHSADRLLEDALCIFNGETPQSESVHLLQEGSRKRWRSEDREL